MAAGESFVYLEIAEAVRRLIVSGELTAGDRLPPIRVMADRWSCTPNTVSRAYSLLSREGLVSAHRGGGTRVAAYREGLSGSTSPEWRWADLVNRAENYLLEAVGLGHNPAHAEAALTAAISRWQELRSRPSPIEGGSTREAREPWCLRFSGSHDLSVEILGRFLGEQTPSVALTTDFVGSLGGLIALARGQADIAGSHLWDEVTGAYNVPFVQRVLPNRRMVLLNLVKRLQGFMVPSGNPQELVAVADLVRPGVVFVNRQSGSGTRVWLDVQLKAADLLPESIAGYGDEESNHLGVARAVAEGRATVGIGISAAATAYGLDFVALGEETYDLVVPLDIWDSPALRALRSVVLSEHFREAVSALGGYDVSQMGVETHLD